MAKRIEFIGVSGVGKSTTKKMLETQWESGENWMLYGTLLRKNIPRSQKLKEVLMYHFRKLIKPTAFRELPNIERSKLSTFVKNHPQLMDALWETVNSHKSYFGTDLRFQEIEYVKFILEKIQIILDHDSEKYCILDEGLIHNLNYFVSNPSDFNEVCQKLNLMKLPDAVVYFEADIGLIMERILMRNSLIIRDENLSQEELLQSRIEAIKEKQIFIQAIRSKNIPVLKLKAEETVQEKAMKIISFVRILEKKETEILQ